MLWLASARSLADAGRTTLLLALAVAWLAALTSAMRQWRQAFGVSSSGRAVPAPRPVPALARLALWVAVAGLVGLGVVRLWRGV